MSVQVSAIHYYPVKSCAGVEVSSRALGWRGLKNDREWMVISADNTQITQRDVPGMALIKVSVTPDEGLILTAPAMNELVVPRCTTGEERQAVVWGTQCQAGDQGDDAAEWLSRYLKISCRLVVMNEGFRRRVDEKRLPDREFLTGFADGYPLLLMSAASLNALNDRLAVPVAMNRFRPNLVIDGCSAFEEDTWKRIEINGIIMRIVKPCVRCVMVTINQEDASMAQEPMRTLASFRNVDGKVLFGQNLAHEQPGTISLGDAVRVLEPARQ